MELKELKAVYYKDKDVLELYHGDKLLTAEIVEGNDFWFGLPIYGEEYDFNVFNGKLGMYECEPTHPEQTPWTNFKTGEFIHNVSMQII